MCLELYGVKKRFWELNLYNSYWESLISFSCITKMIMSSDDNLEYFQLVENIV